MVMNSLERLQRYDRPGPRYTSYPTAVEFHEGVGAAAYASHLQQADRAAQMPWSLYVHLPFCEERCLFCACHMIRTKHRHVAQKYLGYLFRELELVASHLQHRRQVTQLHWGGGTPTYYAPEDLEALMEQLRRHFVFAPDAELALEVDPAVTTLEHLDCLAALGFNRLSMGVQDFHPEVQRAIRRIQPFEQTATLVEEARARGLDAINFDLIYGLPHQTVARFGETIQQVLSLAPQRLAIYSFAFVPWLKGHQKKLQEEGLPGAQEKLALLEEARGRLLAAGYVDIGMDHFARPDDPLAVAQREGRLWRNFMGYTTHQAPDCLGLGCSSIGQVQGAFFQNFKKLSTYYEAIDAQTMPVARGVQLHQDDLIRQALIQDLMCHFSIDKTHLEDRFSIDFDAYFAQELDELQVFAAEDFLTLENQRIHVHGLGKRLVRNIAMVFDRYLREKQRNRPTFSRTV